MGPGSISIFKNRIKVLSVSSVVKRAILEIELCQRLSDYREMRGSVLLNIGELVTWIMCAFNNQSHYSLNVNEYPQHSNIVYRYCRNE